MAIIYIVSALTLIISNIQLLPGAIKAVVYGAFGIRPIAGGAIASIAISMQKGVARGIFSNEAGLGSAPIASAAAKTKDTVRQGLVTMTGTFIDTIIVCTMTGLSIVMMGSWANENLEGVQVTTDAFQKGLYFISDNAAAAILMLCLVFFAFTTILGWNYYGEKCLEYLSNGNKKAVKIYKWLYIFAVFIGPYMTVSAVWMIADIFNGLMAIPNIIALVALSGVVAKETKEYFAKNKK
jgi:AGCS family alanine or glycine:cation symporter